MIVLPINRHSALLPVAVLALAALSWAQANPRGEARVTLAGKAIAIEYGRPSLKGRDMIAQAEVGQAWRLGADAATTLKTDADLAFGADVVPKGEYVLTATRVAEDRWQLQVSDRQRAKVVEVPLASSKLKESVETFTIQLSGDKDKGELALSWGDTALRAVFTAK